MMTTEHNPCLLIIEDDTSCQKVHTLLITQQGYSADLATTGEEAVAMTTDNHYALILTDIGLPGIDGFNAAAQIRQQTAHRSTPIIAITAHAMSHKDQHHARSVGINQIIEKPLTTKKLMDVLAQHLPDSPFHDNGQQKTVKGGHKQYDLPALDVGRVMRTMKISQADALHLQQLFVEDLREHYEIFRQPPTLANQKKIKRSVHKINGGSHFGGAFRLQKLCSELEYTWQHTDESHESEKLFSAVIKEMERIFIAHEEKK
ncbi:MAG: response regulator [Gammaproteobacteria bacterium]|nr:response regulator [Gammaproteobacteria bacterium]